MRPLTRSFNGKWKQRGFGRLKGRDVERLDTFEKRDQIVLQIEYVM
jgi:hypothetical protein